MWSEDRRVGMESLSPERLPGHPHQVTVSARPVTNQQGEPGANKPTVAERRVGLVSVWLRERRLSFGSYGVGRGEQHPPIQVGTWGP